MELRPYQQEAVDAVFREWEAVDSTMLVMGTGSGKTIVFSEVIKRLHEQGKKVLVIAHQDQLIKQAQEKLYRHAEISSAIEKAQQHATLEDDVVIASLQTLYRDERLEQFPPDHFDAIIVDECHHAMTDTYQKILSYFNHAKLLGVTATPNRSDLRSIAEIFETTAYQFGIKDGIDNGYLCPVNICTCPLEIDVSDVAMQGGDYQSGSLGEVLDTYLDAIADQIVERAAGRKILVFVPLIRTGEKFAELLNEKGLRAKNISGKSKDRDELIDEFHSGQIDVLTNALLLTEGFDDPAVDCIVNLRATKSPSLYTQILGRGLRPSPDTNKENLLVLDFLWQSKQKGYDILSPIEVLLPQEDVPYARDILTNSDGEMSAADLLAESEEARNKAEEALVRKLYAAQNHHFKDVNFKEKNTENVIYQYNEDDELDCVIIKSDALSYLQPLFGKNLDHFYPIHRWECEPTTHNQDEVLKKNGFKDLIQFRGQAAQLINAIITRREHGFCTYKQAEALRSRGFVNTKFWSAEDAKDMLQTIADNSWITPYWIKPKSYMPKSMRLFLKTTAHADYKRVGDDETKKTQAMRICDKKRIDYKTEETRTAEEHYLMSR